MMKQLLSYVLFVLISTIIVNTVLWAVIALIVMLASFVFWDLPSLDLESLLWLFRALLSGSFLYSLVYSIFPEAQREWRV